MDGYTPTIHPPEAQGKDRWMGAPLPSTPPRLRVKTDGWVHPYHPPPRGLKAYNRVLE